MLVTNRMIQIFCLGFISASITTWAGDWDEKRRASESELVRLNMPEIPNLPPAFTGADFKPGNVVQIVSNAAASARSTSLTKKLAGLGLTAGKAGADFLAVILTIDQLAALADLTGEMVKNTCDPKNALCINQYQNMVDKEMWTYWITVATIGAGLVAIIFDFAAFSAYFCGKQQRLRDNAGAPLLTIAQVFSVLGLAGGLWSNGILYDISLNNGNHLPTGVVASMTNAMIRGGEAIAPNLATLIGSIFVCWFMGQ